MKGSTLIAVVIGALVVGFVGGIVGGLLFQQGGDTSALEARLSGVESRLAALEGKTLEIAYVDAENLFLKVFLPQVDAQAMTQKQQEIQQLQVRYMQGELDQDQYQQQVAKLQAELLKAQLTVDLTMLDKMIASPGFANFKGDLQKIKDQAKPLADEVDNLLQTAEVGIVNMEGFLAQYRQLQAAFQQLDQLLTQAAAAKIVEIAQQVAREKGFDLVLRKKDVLIYYNSSTVSDISGDVEGRLWNLFSASSSLSSTYTSIPYRIHGTRDVSMANCVRIVADIALGTSQHLDNAQLIDIAGQVVQTITATTSVNAIGVFFWKPGSNIGAESAAASVDWAPFGQWDRACDVSTGDYTKHTYQVVFSNT